MNLTLPSIIPITIVVLGLFASACEQLKEPVDVDFIFEAMMKKATLNGESGSKT